MVATRLGGWRYEVAERLSAEPVAVIEREIARLIDPASATQTIHWGRNYLYKATLELDSQTLPVVVKQFRNHSWQARAKRRIRGSKAMLSFRMARRLGECGIATPEPLLVVDSEEISGASYYLCRCLEGALEARYPIRAINAGTVEEDFPQLDPERLLYRMGGLVRRLHDNGIWHRDMTSGNVLIAPKTEHETPASDYDLYLVDLNRARDVGRLSSHQKAVELGRMPIERAADQETYLRGYCEPESVTALFRQRYRFHHGVFLARNRSKQGVRGTLRRLKDLFLPRLRPHVHIPAPDPQAGARDKIVWDPLSDQPHQHASRLEKLRVRLADAPGHATSLWVGARALSKARRYVRELSREAPSQEVGFDGIGLCIRPWPENRRGLLEAIDALGVRRALLRLHPWQDDHEEEELLAQALTARDVEIAFALPQNRELVREPDRWQAAIETLAGRFAPLGRHFQIGQAINRSKWGVWNDSEYVELFRRAATALRAVRKDVQLLGPAVIDFEPLATAALLNLDRDGLRFDALASLLYVDRRGAPEGTQFGLDTVGKVTLLEALAQTSRNCPSGRSWVTEFNWPLREGPHSPAGKDVAVDEQTQADYLVRYFLLTLASGRLERAYWWQLIAKGYGLIDPLGEGALRRRPAFEALRVLIDQSHGAVVRNPVQQGVGPRSAGTRIVELRRAGKADLVVAWTTLESPTLEELPRPAIARISRDGERQEWPQSRVRVELGPSPTYFELLANGE